MDPKIQTVQRFVLIDSIRGLAALSVACYHFYNQLSENASEALWGRPIQVLMTHGYLGVEVFFVLSGFVIACSLHGVRIDSVVAGKFALRRSLRLDPSYWTVIFLVLFSTWTANYQHWGSPPEIPSVADVIANMFYLDNLLGFRSIVQVGWTLCLEIQFYLVFVLLGWLACSWGGAQPNARIRAVLFGPLAAYSLLVYAGIVPLDLRGVFVPYWFMYFLGVVVWWTLSSEVSSRWLWCGIAACCATASLRERAGMSVVETAVVIATAIGIYWAGRAGRMDTLLSGSVFRYFGRISYSLYLIHPLVGLKSLRLVQRLCENADIAVGPFSALLLFLGAMVVSVGAAHLFYTLIELPSHRLSRRVRWSKAKALPASAAAQQVPSAPSAAPVPAAIGLKAGVLAAARQLVEFCLREKRWAICTALLVFVWTIELFAVQAMTLTYPNETGARFAFWAPKIRLVLDLLFISTLTIWFGRRSLALILIGAFFAYLGLVTYSQYFQRPLSMLTAFSNWREGSVVGEYANELISKRVAVVLSLVLATKLLALVLSRRAVLPRNCAWLTCGVLAMAYLSLTLVANGWDPLSLIQTKRGVGRLGVVRGYIAPWMAEWYYLGGPQVLERAVELRKTKYDRLTPVEANIPIHKRLVIVQAESLDYNVLGFKVDGVAVTPFLNRLRDISMFYRVQAMHFNGSADADFVTMNAVAGSKHENTYTIPGYPYENTTPQVLARCGFSVSSFHGQSGQFYRRRPAFEKMGFESIYFREELEGRYGMKADRWGVTDRDVLTFSALKMREATEPTCHFIITLTTHTPYTFLAPGEREIFSHPRSTLEHYLNNMRYLDNCIRDYITSLGSGTTIMLYADHPTEPGSSDAEFSPDRADGREFIPVFIYDTDRDLSKVQKTRKRPVRKDGSLNLVDLTNYLRGQVTLEFGPPEAAVAAGQLGKGQERKPAEQAVP